MPDLGLGLSTSKATFGLTSGGSSPIQLVTVSDLSAVDNGSGSLLITWIDPAFVPIGIRLLIGRDGDNILDDTIPSGTETYTVSGAGTYAVSLENEGNGTSYLTSASATVSGVEVTGSVKLEPVTSLAAVDSGEESLSITWTDPVSIPVWLLLVVSRDGTPVVSQTLGAGVESYEVPSIGEYDVSIVNVGDGISSSDSDAATVYDVEVGEYTITGPSDLSGYNLDYDPDAITGAQDDAISVCPDSSPSEIDTQIAGGTTAPTLELNYFGSHSGLRFDGINDTMTSGNSIAGGIGGIRTVLIIADLDAAGTSWSLANQDGGGAPSNGTWHSTGHNEGAFGFLYKGARQENHPEFMPSTGLHSFLISSGTDYHELFIDGVGQGRMVGNPIGNAYLNFGSNGQGSNFCKHVLGRFTHFAAVFSPAQQRALMRWARDEYGTPYSEETTNQGRANLIWDADPNLTGHPLVELSAIVAGVYTSTDPHGLLVGDRFYLYEVVGGIGTGVTSSSDNSVLETPYFVKTAPTDSTFTASETPGGTACTGSATGAKFRGWMVDSAQEATAIQFADGEYMVAFTGGWDYAATALATSDDGITWTKNHTPIMGLGYGGESGSCFRPNLRIDPDDPTQNTLILRYSTPDSGGGDWKAAFSTDRGVTWGGNTVCIARTLAPSGASPTGHANSGSVRVGSDTYALLEWHTNENSWAITRTTSSDGVTFSTQLEVPSLQRGPAELHSMYGGPNLNQFGARFWAFYHASRGFEINAIVPTRCYLALCDEFNGDNWIQVPNPFIDMTDIPQFGDFITPDQVADPDMLAELNGSTSFRCEILDNAHKQSLIFCGRLPFQFTS